LHTGAPLLSEEGYTGREVVLGARIASSAHGGQVVLSSATRQLADDLLFTGLGEHRFKDVDEPVAVHQLGAGLFPPLKTISNTNLPRPASSFVGREAELAAVVSRLEEGARLLTLTGPGGSGKTRLAIEVATALVPEYAGGVYWVGLAAARDVALVTVHMAQALGAKDGIAEQIGERAMLVLVDNLEQVIDAAADLATLLRTCPNLVLLVTSRELMRVTGEVEYPVPPLAEPDAVTLFCQRSGLDVSEEIGELCARLDSMPLAVELAAARTKALSPGQILERLSQILDLLKGGRDQDPRQQTLRATIEWSYDLLSRDEQELFAPAAVFAGSWSLAQPEAGSATDLTPALLVEKSLAFLERRF
jgi:predicted ATPase